jgi:hypothetical protein
MTDPVTFAWARVGEDDAVATAAAAYGANWRLADPDRSSAIESDRDAIDRIVVYDEGSPTIEQATHIARYDPGRALRDVEVWRRILVTHAEFRAEAEAQRAAAGEVGPTVWATLQTLDRLIRIRTTVWADHPDFDPKWLP